jgi:tripartite-type tricarboxylate transporter receptor subunit TctC
LRQLAPFIGQRLLGEPTMAIENRPGAGGLIAANHMYNNVAPDGLTLGFLTGITIQSLVSSPQVKYDLTGFRWVASIPQTQVLVGRKELGINSPADFKTPLKPLIHGSSGAGSPSTVLTTLFFRMAGIEAKLVTGYRGQADSDLALLRGEISTADMGVTTFISQQKRIVQEGVITGLLQRGVYRTDGSFTRHPLLPDIKTMPEALDELNPAARKSAEFDAFALTVGSFGVHFGFVLPPKTSDEILDDFRKATYEALDDAATRKLIQERLNLPYDVISGADSENLVLGLRQTLAGKPAVKDLLQKLMME